VSPPACSMEPTTLVTRPIYVLIHLITLSKTGRTNILVIFQTRTHIFLVIIFQGSKCSFAGEQAIKGEVGVLAPSGESEETLQAIEGVGSFENNSLEMDKFKAFIEGGKALLKLASGQRWSFRE